MKTDKSIHAAIEQQARTKAQKVALVWHQETLTYEQLNTKANQLAHYLLTQNLQPDRPIAFYLNRSFDCLITMLAILKAGRAYLPLDISYPKERFSLILKDSQASCLITHSTFKSQTQWFKKNLILIDALQAELEQQPCQNPNLAFHERQLAYIIYTSGSTGLPKGVLIEHRSVINYCDWFAEFSLLDQRQRVDFSANHSFDMAVSISLVPMMLGSELIIADEAIKQNIRSYLNYLKNYKINLIKLTPSFFKVLLQEVQAHFVKLPHLKQIILGGENLQAKECRAWLELYPRHQLHNEYGPTETTIAVSQYSIDKNKLPHSWINVPIGQLGNNMYGLLLDSKNKPIAKGEVGELHVGGICLARGYLKQPSLTQQKFIKINLNQKYKEQLLGDPTGLKKETLFYKTGDLCRLNSQGLLEYLGRVDAQVKIRGFRIEPGEVEKHLTSYFAIKDAIILPQKDALNEDRLLAYYVLKETLPPPSPSHLRTHLRQFLPDYMIPSLFIHIDALPLTANGKLDSTGLPTYLPTQHLDPQKKLTAIEQMVAQIWSEELGIQTFGLDDDFFELGGHSLAAARMLSKLNHLKKTKLNLNDFYQAPTIAQLSALLSKAKKKRPIKKGNQERGFPTSQIPLSDFQLMLWVSVTFKAEAKKLNICVRKRLQGHPEKEALNFAFKALLEKQEALFYQISNLKPLQKIHGELAFKIREFDLEYLSLQEAEFVLKDSMQELMHYYPWPKNEPLLIARLFYLENKQVELHIALPHIISDDRSPEILLADLSCFYSLYKNQSKIEIEKTTSFKKYIFQEQEYLQHYLDRDIHFWNDYLKDAGLFKFSPLVVEHKMKDKKIPYSTFTEIPELNIDRLKHFCAQKQISLYEGLCAAIASALQQWSKECAQMPYVYMNRVKSTRTQEDYDDTIGCFLRLEPIKISLNKALSFDSLLQDLHQSIMDTYPYQNGSDLIKLSLLNPFRARKDRLKQIFLKTCAHIYASLFSLSEINRKIFKLFIKRLSLLNLGTDFLININVQNNFIASALDEPSHLFGLPSQSISKNQEDLLAIDNIFDVCFFREENQKAYLVISANLRPEIRQKIAEETIEIMGSVSLNQEQLPP